MRKKTNDKCNAKCEHINYFAIPSIVYLSDHNMYLGQCERSEIKTAQKDKL